jgi:hypothetical protein
MHSKKSELNKPRCTGKEIVTGLLEDKVCELITEFMLDPKKLRSHIAVLKERKQDVQLRLRRKLRRADGKIENVRTKKQRVIELYAGGSIEREDYVRKSMSYDAKIALLNEERLEIVRQIPAIHKTDVVEASIKQFCRTAQLRFEKCTDFDTKRQFFLDYLDKVVYFEDQIAIHGSVPIEQDAEGEDKGRIEFKITGKITKAERKARYMKYRSGYEQITLPQFNGFSN